jgi:hypothetical protein
MSSEPEESKNRTLIALMGEIARTYPRETLLFIYLISLVIAAVYVPCNVTFLGGEFSPQVSGYHFIFSSFAQMSHIDYGRIALEITAATGIWGIALVALNIFSPARK